MVGGEWTILGQIACFNLNLTSSPYSLKLGENRVKPYTRGLPQVSLHIPNERLSRRLLIRARRQAAFQLQKALGGSLWHGQVFADEPRRNDRAGLGQLRHHFGDR